MALTLKEIAQKIAHNPKLVIVEDYEIGVEERLVDSKSISSDRVSKSVQKELLVTLRLLHRKRVGESFTAATDIESLNSLVDNAMSAAEYSIPCPWFRFPIWRNLLNETGNAGPTHCNMDGITAPEGVVITIVRERKQKRLLRKTEKIILEQSYECFQVELLAGIVVDGREIKLLEKLNNPQGVDAITRAAKKIASQRKYFNQAVSLSVNDLPTLVFSQSVAAGILERLAPYFAADHSAAESFWHQKKGALSCQVDIIDDGKKDFSLGEFFDFEGVLGQEVVLVREGKLQSFLHNTTTGARHNRPGTGSLRSFDSGRGAKISHSNLYMGKGNKKIEEMLQKVKEGAFIEMAFNWELFERNGCEFVRFDVLGWKIEKGEGKFPFFCEKVLFKLANYLESISEISDSVEWHGKIGSPAVSVQNLF